MSPQRWGETNDDSQLIRGDCTALGRTQKIKRRCIMRRMEMVKENGSTIGRKIAQRHDMEKAILSNPIYIDIGIL